MYDPDRMKRIQNILDNHTKRKATSALNPDPRPPSAMVGQYNCEGYIPDNQGNLVRVIAEVTDDDWVGPGSYDPTMPTALTKNVKISNNSRRTDLCNYSVKPGPCDYIKKPKDTKMHHRLHYLSPPPTPPAPLGGSLEHPDWVKYPPTSFPHARYPETQFNGDIHTPQFMSGTHRELFPIRFITPSPTSHAPQPQPPIYTEEDENTVFKSKAERFEIKGPFTPASTTYTLPDDFGKSQTKLIKKPITIKKAPPPEYPEPTQYAPESIINPPNLKVKDYAFRTKTERFADPKFVTPSPVDYETEKDPPARNNWIHPKLPRPGSEWDDIPTKYTPPAGQYETPVKWCQKDGYISTIGHNPYDIPEERPLAFRTQHSTLIRKSFNARYFEATNPRNNK